MADAPENACKPEQRTATPMYSPDESRRHGPSIADSDRTAVSGHPSILSSRSASPKSYASPLDSGSSRQEQFDNVAIPAHDVHDPDPTRAPPSGECVDPSEHPDLFLGGIKFIPVSPSTLSHWRYTGRPMVYVVLISMDAHVSLTHFSNSPDAPGISSIESMQYETECV